VIPCSSNAFAMMVVLEIAMMAPAKMLARGPAEGLASYESEPDHDVALDDRGQTGRYAHLYELAQPNRDRARTSAE
jgi:hypothetical protein